MQTYLVLVFMTSEEGVDDGLSFQERVKEIEAVREYSDRLTSGGQLKMVYHIEGKLRTFDSDAEYPRSDENDARTIPVTMLMLQARTWQELSELVLNHPEYHDDERYFFEVYELRSVEGIKSKDRSAIRRMS